MDRESMMRIGIGLPTAIPGRPAREVRRWAVASEERGFHSLGSIDRLVYDVLDPLVTLGVAAAVTERVELFTTILNVGWRNNPVLLAKQLATVDLISAGRLTAGLGTGAWPDDFAVSGVPATGHARLFDDIVREMQKVWNGEVKSVGGPMPLPGPDRPRLLFGGMAPRAYARAARFGSGWVAPLLGRELLVQGIEAVTAEWKRPGKPQIAVGRYFSLGNNAAPEYVAHYYGAEYADQVLADCIDSDETLVRQLTELADAGADDVLLYPCSGDRDQVHLLADALERVGAVREPTFRWAAAAAA
jgi:alkanesulfonate monooxygenase SsuD/methylene tetrahydromethanopterin reductase-like flavin-dependent oxidoreductase (luciferase family)